MRIIAGTAKRKALAVADGTATRPFLEMARGALFNSLGDAIAGASVLDVFAGSGALGLEALSRGAESCLFIEQDRRAFAVLEKNIANCGMANRSRAMRADAATALAGMSGSFDVIFLDPPFAELPEWRDGGKAWPLMADAARLLGDTGILFFRLEEKKAVAPDWPGLVLESDRAYGRSRICRFAATGHSLETRHGT